MFEVSFRQIFGSFLNTEGFCRVFIPGLGGFLSYSYIKSEKFLWASFPVSFPPYQKQASGFSLFAFSGEFSSVPFFFFFAILCCIS